MSQAAALKWQPAPWRRHSISTALPFIFALTACSTDEASKANGSPAGSSSAFPGSGAPSTDVTGVSPAAPSIAPLGPAATITLPVNPAPTQTEPAADPLPTSSAPPSVMGADAGIGGESVDGNDSDTRDVGSEGGSEPGTSTGADDTTAAGRADAGGEGAGGAHNMDSGLGDGDDLRSLASGLHELFIHDACSGANDQQSDTCLHVQEIEVPVEFGGETGTLYKVRLRVRGLFEPTSINGGETPYPEHPSFKIGGMVAAPDYSHWHIEVSDPPQIYWLNHYPQTSHTIYSLDFEADIQVAAGATVYVRVIDANDRQIDNGTMQDLPDRHQTIDGVTDGVPDGQVLRLDVVNVQAL